MYSRSIPRLGPYHTKFQPHDARGRGYVRACDGCARAHEEYRDEKGVRRPYAAISVNRPKSKSENGSKNGDKRNYMHVRYKVTSSKASRPRWHHTSQHSKVWALRPQESWLYLWYSSRRVTECFFFFFVCKSARAREKTQLSKTYKIGRAHV